MINVAYLNYHEYSNEALKRLENFDMVYGIYLGLQINRS